MKPRLVIYSPGPVTPGEDEVALTLDGGGVTVKPGLVIYSPWSRRPGLGSLNAEQ